MDLQVQAKSCKGGLAIPGEKKSQEEERKARIFVGGGLRKRILLRNILRAGESNITQTTTCHPAEARDSEGSKGKAV